jgi:[protein-PII] uridylyltransferase
VKHFPFEPKVEIVRTRTGNAWQVFATCADRPGLLSAIARAMLARGLNLIDARVTTLGARAEDVFVVSGAALEEEGSRAAFAAELRAVLAGESQG